MQTSSATVGRIQSIARDTLELTLWPDVTLRFLAGQFVMVTIPEAGGTDQRAYSIYSDPDEEEQIVLVVRLVPGGKASEYVRNLRVGQRVEFRGPFGRFVLGEGDGPIRMIATGTGLVPFRSMLEVAARKADRRCFRLLYGSREQHDVFGLEHLDRLRSELSDFTYTACLSRPIEGWRGAEGRVNEQLAERPREAPGQYYLCGNGSMICEVRARLAAREIPKAAIHFERFD